MRVPRTEYAETRQSPLPGHHHGGQDAGESEARATRWIRKTAEVRRATCRQDACHDRVGTLIFYPPYRRTRGVLVRPCRSHPSERVDESGCPDSVVSA